MAEFDESRIKPEHRGYVKPDYSLPLTLNLEGRMENALLNRRYDHIHLFRGLGNYAIIKLITENGFMELACNIDDALQAAENSGIIPIERTDISFAEYDMYLSVMKKMREKQIAEWADNIDALEAEFNQDDFSIPDTLPYDWLDDGTES